MELQPEKKLASCKHGEQFWAANGGQYWNLYDLARGLQAMDDGTFTHHVNQQRNDFHAWVHDVVGDSTLAHGLLHMHDRESMMRRVVLRVRFLELMKDSSIAPPRASVKKSAKVPARKKAAPKAAPTSAKKTSRGRKR